QTTPSGGARLARRKQPTTAFVPFRTVRLPTLPNRPPIDHAIAGSAQPGTEESSTTESKRRIAIHGRSRFTYRCGCPYLEPRACADAPKRRRLSQRRRDKSTTAKPAPSTKAN